MVEENPEQELQKVISEPSMPKQPSAVLKKSHKIYFIIGGIVVALILILLIRTLFFHPITSEPSNVNYIKILEQNKDYQEYSQDFFSKYSRYPEFTMNSDVLLTKQYIEQKLAEINNTGMQAYSIVFENLTGSNNLHLIELKETQDANKGLIAVIDLDKKEALKVYAALNILIKGG